jgi:tripartite-type tricarboxylate transporter receptor subunit TctC
MQKTGSALTRLSAVAMFLAAAGAMAADAYPDRPLRLIVAFTPGGSLDLTARLIAQRLTDSIGQPVIVDNRPGAGGLTGSDMVAKATPDGYTLLMASGSNAVNVALYPKASHHFGRDFGAVTQAVSNAYLLTAVPTLPANSVKELIALARARPGQLNYGSSGTGGLPHLAGELFKSMTGVTMTHVPYKGAAPAIVDLIAGRVEIMFNALPLQLPHVKSGKLKALAVTTLRRAEVLPDVPTVDESGVPGYDLNGWYGVVAPVRTSAAVVAKLNLEIVRILALPEVREKLKAEGSDPVGSTPEQFAAVIRADIDKWVRLTRAANIKLE